MQKALKATSVKNEIIILSEYSVSAHIDFHQILSLQTAKSQPHSIQKRQYLGINYKSLMKMLILNEK